MTVQDATHLAVGDMVKHLPSGRIGKVVFFALFRGYLNVRFPGVPWDECCYLKDLVWVKE